MKPRRIESADNPERFIDVDFLPEWHSVEISQPVGDRDYIDDDDVIVADAQQIQGLIQYLTECLAEIKQ